MTHTNYIFYTFSQGLQILWHPKKKPRIYGILVKVIQSQQRCQSALNTIKDGIGESVKLLKTITDKDSISNDV